MEVSLDWMITNAHWLWWSAGVVLLASEMIIPGVYLLWIGIAAAITGIFAWVAPGMGFEGHGLIFAVLATISIYVGNRFFYQKASTIEDQKVNDRGKSFIGQQFLVVAEVKNGQGHVKVGDSRWMARGPDIAEGEMATVTSVDGTVLVVEAARNTQ